MSRHLQDRIDFAISHRRPLTIRDEVFPIDQQINVHGPLAINAMNTVVKVVNYDPKRFENHRSVIACHAPNTEIVGMRLEGPGARGNDGIVGFRLMGDDSALISCASMNFQYALYALQADRCSMFGCTGSHLLNPDEWQGLSYGIVIDKRNRPQVVGCRVSNCTVSAARHAIVFGEGTFGCDASENTFTNTANVSAVAFKPTSEHNVLAGNYINAGINIGGHYQFIAGNQIVTNPHYRQTCIAILGNWTTMKTWHHRITNNRILAHMNKEVRQKYAIIWLTDHQNQIEYDGNSTMIDKNHFMIEGAAKVVGGDWGLMGSPILKDNTEVNFERATP